MAPQLVVVQLWIPVLVAMIAAIPPTLVAYVAWRALEKKTDEIHVLVNSNLSKVKADLASAVEEIRLLHRDAE